MSVVAAVVVVAAGCGGGQLDATDYDTSCTVDDDCAIVSLAVCDDGCAAADDAVNAAEVERVADDRAAASGFCGIRPNVDCLFGGTFAATCVDGTCTAVQVVDDFPPSFSFQAPRTDVVLPTNARFTGHVIPGSDGSRDLPVTLVVEGEDTPRAPVLTNAHCDRVNGCEDSRSKPRPRPATRITSSQRACSSASRRSPTTSASPTAASFAPSTAVTRCSSSA